MFRITIPVEELLGIETGAAVTDVQVRCHPQWNCVKMKAKCVTFGRDELDQHLTVVARLALHQSPAHSRWNPLRFRRRSINTLLEDYEQLERMQSSEALSQSSPNEDLLSLRSFDTIQIETDVPEQRKMAESHPGESSGRNWVRLNMAVQLHLKIVIPPFLSGVPRVVLGSCGRFIIQYLMNQLSRRFLKHVVSDYHAWATDAPRGVQQSGGLFAFEEAEEEISGGDETFGQAWSQ